MKATKSKRKSRPRQKAAQERAGLSSASHVPLPVGSQARNPHQLTLRKPEHGPETDAERSAWLSLTPGIVNTITAKRYAAPSFADPIDLTMAVEETMRQIASVQSGDMSNVKGMLLSQANALQAIFTEMARRAGNFLDNPEIADIYLRLGLKAQSQCRSNLEAIAEINLPRTVFAKQANFAAGPQQVNNNAGPASPPPRPENENPTTKVLEFPVGERRSREAGDGQ